MSAATLPRADGRRPPAPWLVGLAAAAIGVTGLTVGATLLVAGATLGYDFLAYHAAATRLLEGRPLYDAAAAVAGPQGLFLYPPPFALLALPFGLLDAGPATVLWIGGLLAAFGVGVAIMPVPMAVRWAVLLLAGLSWPFVYAVKLGQVGPLLFLLFAVAWRWIDRPSIVGVAAAVGTAVKLQPGILFGWALFRRQWGVLVAGAIALVALALVALPLTGISAWADYASLLGRVSDPIATPHNFTPGAVAFQLGVPRDIAAGLQLVSSALVLALVAFAALRCTAEASLLVAVVASQLLSPVLWDHYAMLLLLPVAWLLARRAWWAALIPLSAAVPLVGLVPSVTYPIAFWVTIVAVAVIGSLRAQAPTRAS